MEHQDVRAPSPGGCASSFTPGVRRTRRPHIIGPERKTHRPDHRAPAVRATGIRLCWNRIVAVRPGENEALRCSFCSKSQDVVAQLISSPASLPRAYICDQCVRASAGAVRNQAAPTHEGRAANAPACSFCSKGPPAFRLLPAPGDPPGTFICEECLAVCQMIIEDDATSAT